ncbi:unnamed protein product [Rotaria sp. Silwood2]|nr:unnamed protein product [Rotaria sp. Silwood2]
MHRKILLRGSAVLILFILSIAYVNGEDETVATTIADSLCEGDDCEKGTTVEEVTTVKSVSETVDTDETTQKPTTTIETTQKPTTTIRTTQKPTTTIRTTQKPKLQKDQLQQLKDRFQIFVSYFRTNTAKYDNKRKRPGYDRNREDNDDDSYGIMNENQRSPLDSLNLWIAYSNGWLLDDRLRCHGQGRGEYCDNENYNEEQDYEDSSDDDDNKKENYRKQRLYARVRFPVRHYPNYHQFPIRRFPSLVSILPWLPIFYDKITYQTIIFSPTGGLYILPPLINFYGQRFAVAQLIKWGYASLVSTGASPPPNVDVAPFIQQSPAVNVGGTAPPTSGLAFDEKRVQFTDGVKTNFRYVKPQYSQTLVEGGYDYYEPSYDKNYGLDSNYDTTSKQQTYAQKIENK